MSAIAGMVVDEVRVVVNCVAGLARDARGPFVSALCGLDDDLKLLAVELVQGLADARDRKHLAAAADALTQPERAAPLGVDGGDAAPRPRGRLCDQVTGDARAHPRWS